MLFCESLPSGFPACFPLPFYHTASASRPQITPPGSRYPANTGEVRRLQVALLVFVNRGRCTPFSAARRVVPVSLS